MLVHLCLSVLLTVISLIVFICTVTYVLINDDDDDDELRLSKFSYLHSNNWLNGVRFGSETEVCV